MMNKVNALKRWAPLLGVALIAGSTIARAFGYADAGRAIDIIGTLTGFGTESPVSATELLAAAAAVSGVALKVLSLLKAQ
jgi:hypothetical protein